MVATRYAYSKGRVLVRGISAISAVLFGFIALFFIVAPKSWSSENSKQDLLLSNLMQNTAHADEPHYGDCAGGDSSTGDSSDSAGSASDSACDAGGAGSCDAGDAG